MKATETALSPNGKEIAFVVRGDVYVVSIEYGDTKRITNTPGQERNVSFSYDGRKLVFAAEHDKSWSLYEASIVQPKDKEPYSLIQPSLTCIRFLRMDRKISFQSIRRTARK